MYSINKKLGSERILWSILLTLGFFEIGLFMLTPFIYQFLIDNVIANKNISYLFLVVLLYFLSYVSVVLIGFLKEVFATRLIQKVIQKVRDDYYTQLKKSKPIYIKNVKIGSEITVLTNEINDIIEHYINSYFNIIVNCIRITIAMIVLSFLNYKLLLILLILLPIYIITTYIFKNKIRENAKEYNIIRETYTNAIHEGIEGYEDIIIYNKSKWDISKVINESRKFIKNRVYNTMLLRAASDISYLFYWGIICVIYYVSAINIISDSFTLGLMLVYVAYLDNIYSPSRIILTSFAKLRNARSLSTNFNQKIYDMKENEEDFSTIKFDYNINIKEIKFKGINFNYNKEGFSLFIDNFKLKSGQKVGVVGESGSGKSTLIKVLSGLYTTPTGTIEINNQLSSSYELRKFTVLCTQNPHLFSIGIDENINFSNEIIDDKDYKNRVYEYLGINSYIDKKPIELSGGQYHRIALARTLISEAKVYIFDEPTASLDLEKRKSFYKLLDDLTEKGKIIIVISHNTEELVNFNMIYNVCEGKILNN